MHRLRTLLVLSLALGSLVAAAQQPTDPKGLLEYGIELFGQDRYREAIDTFGRILADPKASAERPEAAYWSVLAYLAAGDQTTAAASIDAFLAAYPKSPRVPDLLYQRGRILFSKADYEGALKVFASFAEGAPDSDLVPSALYWSGECLYALGRLEEAERAFGVVVDKYPQSVKVEAATYKRSLIGLEYRQRELLKLLTWSHEESLRAVEDFRRRERAYEQSIAIYQKQLSDSKRGAVSEQEKALADLRAQVGEQGGQLATMEAKLQTALAEVESLRTALAQAREQASQNQSQLQAALAAAEAQPRTEAPAPAPQAPALQPDSRSEALAAKARALDLLGFYLERIAQEGSK